ncbi:hypothetical protein [Sphingobium sp. B2]|uniref:hypothetical protein n=1 Tax=Sphingobium sp. B2 TaxID=2583228 RepID=UPI001643B49F|nr:hypothetical protein [Sphingobium sp. B2]
MRKRLLWPRQHRYYPDSASGAQCLFDLGDARLRIDKLALKDRAHVTAEPVSFMQRRILDFRGFPGPRHPGYEQHQVAGRIGAIGSVANSDTVSKIGLMYLSLIHI